MNGGIKKMQINEMLEARKQNLLNENGVNILINSLLERIATLEKQLNPEVKEMEKPKEENKK